MVSIVARVWRYISPGASTPPRALSAVDPEMNTRSPTRTAREYAYCSSRGRPDEMRCALWPAPSTASSSISMSWAGRASRTRVAEVAGQGARRLVRHGDVGDIDAAAHHVRKPAAGLAHAPARDP